MRTLYLSFLKQYNKIIQSFSLYFSQSASVDTFKLSCVDKKTTTKTCPMKLIVICDKDFPFLSWSTDHEIYVCNINLLCLNIVKV